MPKYFYAILMSLSVLILSSNPTQALAIKNYGLQYDSRDGTLTLTGIDRGLVNYVIESDEAFLESMDLTQQLNHELIISFFNFNGQRLFFPGSSSWGSTPSILFETSPSANTAGWGVEGETRSLGPVLPTDLSQSDFESTITRMTYVRAQGQPIEEFELIYIPETDPVLPDTSDNHHLVYDADSGSLTIIARDVRHIDSINKLISYSIESPCDFLLPNNHQTHLNGIATSTSSILSENNPFRPGQATRYELGNVLPIGLTEQEYLDAIGAGTSSAPFYVADFGIPGQNFQLVYVPEPASLGMLALGGLALLRRRSV